jgi:hypothetical protein
MLAAAGRGEIRWTASGEETDMAVTVLPSEVMEALEIANDEMSSYVNKKTGKVVTIGHEELRLAEDDDHGDLVDWQRELVEEARQVLASSEWLSLPDKFEIHEWEISPTSLITVEIRWPRPGSCGRRCWRCQISDGGSSEPRSTRAD